MSIFLANQKKEINKKFLVLCEITPQGVAVVRFVGEGCDTVTSQEYSELHESVNNHPDCESALLALIGFRDEETEETLLLPQTKYSHLYETPLSYNMTHHVPI